MKKIAGMGLNQQYAINAQATRSVHATIVGRKVESNFFQSKNAFVAINCRLPILYEWLSHLLMNATNKCANSGSRGMLILSQIITVVRKLAGDALIWTPVSHAKVSWINLVIANAGQGGLKVQSMQVMQKNAEHLRECDGKRGFIWIWISEGNSTKQDVWTGSFFRDAKFSSQPNFVGHVEVNVCDKLLTMHENSKNQICDVQHGKNKLSGHACLGEVYSSRQWEKVEIMKNTEKICESLQ